MSGSCQKYLFVKHSQNWNSDRCTRWMASNNRMVDWCYPADGQHFPEPSAYAGVVIFGGAYSANDCANYEWVKHELGFVENCLQADTGFFGICLGAQVLARVLGADVRAHPEQVKEIGFSRVDPVVESEQSNAPQFLETPLTVMQWHAEGFDLPPTTQRIASGDVFPNQAFRLNEHVVGVQFHPEVNPDVLAIWHERNKTRPSGVLTEEQRVTMMADAKRYDVQVTDWLHGFLSGWTTCCENAQDSSGF